MPPRSSPRPGYCWNVPMPDDEDNAGCTGIAACHRRPATDHLGHSLVDATWPSTRTNSPGFSRDRATRIFWTLPACSCTTPRPCWHRRPRLRSGGIGLAAGTLESRPAPGLWAAPRLAAVGQHEPPQRHLRPEGFQPGAVRRTGGGSAGAKMRWPRSRSGLIACLGTSERLSREFQGAK